MCPFAQLILTSSVGPLRACVSLVIPNNSLVSPLPTILLHLPFFHLACCLRLCGSRLETHGERSIRLTGKTSSKPIGRNSGDSSSPGLHIRKQGTRKRRSQLSRTGQALYKRPVKEQSSRGAGLWNHSPQLTCPLPPSRVTSSLINRFCFYRHVCVSSPWS